ncbi:hypothetical protein [Nocardia sp. alder85J]|uniref:hypothetical protein n=1 Tax=Nocardia sp. alder85J TaxID=2862949 RepID=UPI001CD2E4EC|nr:hypothetical protein [Nocardia sp. alder85J]MCX4094519.1 hypothetical protein [Nocardia sp. alder85J]
MNTPGPQPRDLVIDLSAPVVVPPLQWHHETDPHELAEWEATQWITAQWNSWFLRIKQHADNGDLTLRISHDRYHDPGWDDTYVYDDIDDAKSSGIATIESTLNGERVRVAVRAIDPVTGGDQWTIVDCPIDALGSYDTEASAIHPRLPRTPTGGSAGFRGAVIVVDGCYGYESGCSTWSHCDIRELGQARREHWDCEHVLVAGITRNAAGRECDR